MNEAYMFCTYITFYSGNKLPPFYLGYSLVSKIAKGYRGTPKSKAYKTIWAEETKTKPNLFKTVILTYHNTQKEAIGKEEYFQRYFNAHVNPMYINKSIGRPNFHIRDRGPMSEETKRKISIANKGNPNRNYTEESRRKTSDALKGKKQNPEAVLKRAKINTGSKRSLETRKRMSESQNGRTLSDETKKKISVGNMGKILSDETRQKMSASSPRLPMSDETKKMLKEMSSKPVEYKGIKYTSLIEAGKVYALEKGYKLESALRLIKKHPEFRML